AEDDETVDSICEVADELVRAVAAMGAQDEHALAAACRTRFVALDDAGVVGTGKIREDDARRVVAAARKRASGAAGPVAEGVDRLLDAALGVRRDGPVAALRSRHRRDRDTGMARDLVDRRLRPYHGTSVAPAPPGRGPGGG